MFSFKVEHVVSLQGVKLISFSYRVSFVLFIKKKYGMFPVNN
jgi:hypothetical protein